MAGPDEHRDQALAHGSGAARQKDSHDGAPFSCRPTAHSDASAMAVRESRSRTFSVRRSTPYSCDSGLWLHRQMTDLAELHDDLRPLMFSIAYRMLGSVAEAEDVVQEAF